MTGDQINGVTRPRYYSFMPANSSAMNALAFACSLWTSVPCFKQLLFNFFLLGSILVLNAFPKDNGNIGQHSSFEKQFWNSLRFNAGEAHLYSVPLVHVTIKSFGH